MKRLITLATLALCLCLAGNALALIGWAGNLWPADGASEVPTGPIDTYCQVWKGGVTDAAGQGAGISAVLHYFTDLDATVYDVAAAYNTDIGNNDEYTADVPQSAIIGASWVTVSYTFYDDEDMSTYDVGPATYTIVPVLPNDIEVGFRLCLSGVATMGDVCVIGSDPAIGSWGTGVNLVNEGGDLWGGQVVFAAGSNPTFEYKYKKDGCADWESVPNRVVTLPTDGSQYYVIPDVDSWNNLPIGCGLGNVLEEEKVVCIQVCLGAAETTGGVCVTGGLDDLTNWGSGKAMGEIGPGLYQACLTFPAGQAIPLTFEFKFRKDGCDTWESVGNRSFTVDNSLPYESDLTFGWDDGEITCVPVDNEASSWGSLKSLFR